MDRPLIQFGGGSLRDRLPHTISGWMRRFTQQVCVSAPISGCPRPHGPETTTHRTGPDWTGRRRSGAVRRSVSARTAGVTAPRASRAGRCRDGPAADTGSGPSRIRRSGDETARRISPRIGAARHVRGKSARPRAVRPSSAGGAGGGAGPGARGAGRGEKLLTTVCSCFVRPIFRDCVQ